MNNKKFILKLFIGGIISSTMFVMLILICVLMIFNFFGTKLTKEKVQNNSEYANEYIMVLNKYLKNGYVPLQRLLYFYLEDTSINLDTLYTINQNNELKIEKEIQDACADQRLKNMNACTQESMKDNEEYLIVSTKKFNFPIKESQFTVTSFFQEQRTVLGKSNVHSGWDFAALEQTPVYSVCNGIVEKVNYFQNENVPSQNGNSYGNSITIKCDRDYDEVYYVIFAHLYPNSSKVKVGDIVSHWTEIASVGTTGYSTGNHLHFQVENSKREKIDGMELIDFNLLYSTESE